MNKKTSTNKGLPKAGVRCLIEHLEFLKTFVHLPSFGAFLTPPSASPKTLEETIELHETLTKSQKKLWQKNTL